MISLIALLAAASVSPATEFPLLDGVRPSFGYACHPQAVSDRGAFRYLVYLPEGKPVGDPQKVVVRLTDGSPSWLPKPELMLDARIVYLLVPPRPNVDPNLPPPRIATLSGQSPLGAPVQASIQMFMVAVAIPTNGGGYEMRLKPSNGWVKLHDATTGAERKLSVTCDDISGRAAPAN